MDKLNALKSFIKGALVKDKSRRYINLLNTKHGIDIFMKELPHQFETHIREDKVVNGFNNELMKEQCYIYYYNESIIGCAYESIFTAFDQLSHVDSWLIINTRGTVGVFRPEDRWDDTKWIII